MMNFAQVYSSLPGGVDFQKTTSVDHARVLALLAQVRAKAAEWPTKWSRAKAAGNQKLMKVMLSEVECLAEVEKVLRAAEINQLAERVPQIRKAIIAAFGTADTEIIQKAKITSKQFIDAVVKELEKLPAVTGGAQNTFENLKDSIEQSLLPLGNKLLETILPAIERLAPKVPGLLEGFQKLSKSTQDNVLIFGALAIALGPVLGAFGNLLTVLAQIRAIGGIASIFGAGGATGVLGAIASLNPAILLVSGALIAGSIVWFEYGENIKRTPGFVDQFIERQGRVLGAPLPGVECLGLSGFLARSRLLTPSTMNLG